MKKRYIILIVLSAWLSIPYLLQNISTPEKTIYLSPSFTNTEEAHKIFDKHKPIILWDIHDCLFEKPHFAIWRRGLWNIENKPKFIYEFLKASINKKVYDAFSYQRNRHSYTPQAYFDALKGYTHLYVELHRLINIIYTPNKESFKIVKALHLQGYPQYLFSNIGPVALKDLQHDYPQYFSYFDQLQNTINPITPAYDQWIQKPDKKAYQKALMAVDLHKSPQTVIFIDDRKNNIEQAYKAGMNGIIFVSPEQLQQDLNILIEL
jgi:FMN phosphatase YigB (HAD superfamily)